MNEIGKLIGNPLEVHREEVSINTSFMDAAACFATLPGTVLLMSGGNTDSSNHHILGINPWLTLKGRGQRMRISSEKESLLIEKDPLDTLNAILEQCSIDKSDPALPCQAGLMGYLSYDIKDCLEKLPRTAVDNLLLPHICFFAHSIILVHDKNQCTTTLCIPLRTTQGTAYINEIKDWFFGQLSKTPSDDEGFTGNRNGFTSVFTKKGYMTSVEKIKQYITSGDVYQVNMSQRFEMGFTGSGFGLFKSLFQRNPAPFFSFIHVGDHQIVSTSPERFILQKGRSVETRPIKGTRPRGRTPEEDENFRHELIKSNKDDAELSMIVDLLRNDIGKVCNGGSVYVDEHKRVEAYENVFHLVSIVKGELGTGKTSADLIRAVFPGGSITGCPKIRSMEIIDELEPVCRHIYTGSIGYISFHHTMDLSIAIRTATIYNQRIFFSAGGGVVFDSDPEDEFEETLHKGKSLMEIFNGPGNTATISQEIKPEDKKESCPVSPIVWINGGLKKQGEAFLPITDQGVLYGYGFFETLRAENGAPLFLDAHMERFNTAWAALFFHQPPDLTWPDIIRRVLKANRLDRGTAAVRITATYGDRDLPPYNYSLVVTARPYAHRLSHKPEKALCLATYPEPRETPLAAHKTLNYMYYLLAGKWAKKNGADEALVLNPDGTISETNTANILLVKNRSVILPRSSAVLPGIMQKEVVKLLERWGFTISTKKATPDDMLSHHMIITNSLIGAVPVMSVDGKTLPFQDGFCKKINDSLFHGVTS